MKEKELELKFQVLNKEQLNNFLGKLKFLKRVSTKDVYLDTKDANLYKKGIFVRIRDGSKLQIKFNYSDIINQNKLSMHEICSEYSFNLPLSKNDVEKLNEVLKILSLNQISSSSIHELKERNSLVDSIVIEKEREIFTDGKFLITVDKVKDLGTFLEIEAKVKDDEDVEEIKKEMLNLVKNLDLKRITTGYNELWWRKHDFNVYLQGRYLLEEDYEKFRKQV